MANYMPGFFAMLGTRAGSQQQENQLSSTFQACFRESASFRHIILKRLWRTCRLPNLPPLGRDWVCDVEVAPPLGGGGRVDLRLRVDGDHLKIPTFWIESKVGTPLTQEQLTKYRKRDCKYVVAITRRRPELPPSEIKALGAFALRWQDIHRDLANTSTRSQKDRFIASSFLSYLEDLGMAHRERITIENLKRVGSVFRSLAPGHSYAVVKDARHGGCGRRIGRDDSNSPVGGLPTASRVEAVGTTKRRIERGPEHLDRLESLQDEVA